MIYELTVESAAGQRIDKYLSEQLADLSRSYLQKLLKDGGVEDLPGGTGGGRAGD